MPRGRGVIAKEIKYETERANIDWRVFKHSFHFDSLLVLLIFPRWGSYFCKLKMLK